ncbi:MAG: 1-acyl-sn-glycerol-3-phosphate acyltransferase [Actinomycetia bacterium]|nr:1-acyl-sn-glycerol-3-phosphate acyltransferase [Actinomycetes bacterium]
MWLATTLRAIATPLVRVLFRVREYGRKNVPARGGAVLAGNHRSYMDPVLLWCVSPRFVHFMAKRELFERGLVAWALPRLWAFPVEREGADRAALAQADAFLKKGELVGIFPEGSRQDRDALGEAHGGAAFVALRAGVPIVPVAFVGTEKVWPRGQALPKFRRVTIVYGEPICPEDFPEGSRKERVALLTERIMERISEEVERAKKVH